MNSKKRQCPDVFTSMLRIHNRGKKMKPIMNLERDFPMDVFTIICSYLTTTEWSNLLFTCNKYLLSHLIKPYNLSAIHWDVENYLDNLIFIQGHWKVPNHPDIQLVDHIEKLDIFDLGHASSMMNDANVKSIPYLPFYNFTNIKRLSISNSFVHFKDIGKKEKDDMTFYLNKLEYFSARNSYMDIDDWTPTIKYLSLDYGTICNCMVNDVCHLLSGYITTECIIEIVYDEYMNDYDIWIDGSDDEPSKEWSYFMDTLITFFDNVNIARIELDVRILENCPEQSASRIVFDPKEIGNIDVIKYDFPTIIKTFKNRVRVINLENMNLKESPKKEWIESIITRT